MNSFFVVPSDSFFSVFILSRQSVYPNVIIRMCITICVPIIKNTNLPIVIIYCLSLCMILYHNFRIKSLFSQNSLATRVYGPITLVQVFFQYISLTPRQSIVLIGYTHIIRHINSYAKTIYGINY